MHATQAVILGRDDFRERDERIVFYTRNYGKLTVVAKGTRRIEAKLRGEIDIFNIADIVFVEGEKFAILTNIETKARFLNIGRNPYSYKASLSAASIVSNIFEERLPDALLFDKIRDFLANMNNCISEKDCRLALKDFQIKILENQGYRIEGSNNLLELEDSLARAFLYNLDYKIHSWSPTF